MGNEHSTMKAKSKKNKKKDAKNVKDSPVKATVEAGSDEYTRALSQGVAKQRNMLTNSLKRNNRNSKNVEVRASNSNGVSTQQQHRHSRTEKGSSRESPSEGNILQYEREPRTLSLILKEESTSQADIIDAIPEEITEVTGQPSDNSYVPSQFTGNDCQTTQNASPSSSTAVEDENDNKIKQNLSSKSDTQIVTSQISANDNTKVQSKNQKRRPVSSFVNRNNKYNNENGQRARSATTSDRTSLTSERQRRSSRSSTGSTGGGGDAKRRHARSHSTGNIPNKSKLLVEKKPRPLTYVNSSSRSNRLNSMSIITNKQFDDFRRKKLPGRLQKQLKTQNSATNRRRSVIDFNKKESHVRDLQIPFHFPMNRKVFIKLIPFPGSEDFIKFQQSGKKHVAWVKLTTLKRREVAKTGQLYQAEIVFTEGCMKERLNKTTNVVEKRLLQAQVWSGISQEVEYDDDHVRIMGNFTSFSKGMISYLEFELELRPNYKNIISADTGKVLFAVGAFSFSDIRSVVNKSFQWQAAVEDWVADSFELDFLSSSSNSNSDSSDDSGSENS